MADMKPTSAGAKGELCSLDEDRSTSTTQHTAGTMEELRSWDKDRSTSTTQHTAGTMEELRSWDKDRSTSTTQHTAGTMEELRSWDKDHSTSTTQHTAGTTEELHSWDEDRSTSTTQHTAGTREELHSWDEDRSTSTTQHTAGTREELHSDNEGYAEPQIKVEPFEDEDPPHHTRSLYLTNRIKKEPCDYEEGLLPPADRYVGSTCEDLLPGGGGLPRANVSPPPNSTPYSSSLCIKKESGEDDLGEELEYTTVCIKEEPISGDEGDIPPADIGGCILGVLPEDSTLGGDESDSLSERTEIEYTTVRIKGEESSDEDYLEVVPDTDNHATRDHTYMVTRTDDRMRAPCNTRKLHKTLNCSECGKVFFGKAAYRLHQRLHRGEAIYACSTCGKKFSRKGSCEKHQEAAHSREKSFECANCDRYFSSKLGLTLHQRIHTREPAFACKDCAKSFTSNSALVQHQRVHYTDRRLVCAKCGVTFDNKSDLINHEILHPVQQSFVCSECSEKFLTKAELSAHWKVHTVIKAFSWRKIHFTHQDTRGPEETAPSAAKGQ